MDRLTAKGKALAQQVAAATQDEARAIVREMWVSDGLAELARQRYDAERGDGLTDHEADLLIASMIRVAELPIGAPIYWPSSLPTQDAVRATLMARARRVFQAVKAAPADVQARIYADPLWQGELPVRFETTREMGDAFEPTGEVDERGFRKGVLDVDKAGVTFDDIALDPERPDAEKQLLAVCYAAETILAEYSDDYAPGLTTLQARVLDGLRRADEIQGAAWERLVREANFYVKDLAARVDKSDATTYPKIQTDVADLDDAFNAAARVLNPDKAAQFAVLVDYARPDLDLKARVISGALRYMPGGPGMNRIQYKRWSADVDEFNRQAKIHLYTLDDVRDVRDAIKRSDAKLDEAIQLLGRTLAAYKNGPVHLIALEQQFLALRAGRASIYKPGHAALQRATLDALKRATPYSWSHECVEAVHAASVGLDDDDAPFPEALGAELSAPAACGWWWFDDPIPVKTVTDDRGVCALLWRRENRDGKMATWLSAFVADPLLLNGREVVVPNPSLAWYWFDGDTLGKLRVAAQVIYADAEKNGTAGPDRRPVADSVEAALWFSRFWLAAGLWLEQRVLAKAPTAVPRQPGRALAREHKLKRAPLVEIVLLRRTQPRPAGAATGGPLTPVDWSCRWIVGAANGGFWRNQWFASQGRHSKIWVKSFIKGPKDKPLKTATKVYAVTR